MTARDELVAKALDAAREAQKRYQEASNLYPVFVPPEVSIFAAVKLVVEEAASAIKIRAEAERIMRDDRRRANDHQMAELHGDRATAFDEAAAAIRSLAAKEE